MSSVVGVDIGFQNSVIAAAGRGGVDVILNGNSNRLNPTMIGFDDSRKMGEHAIATATSNYKQTVTSIKRLIGLSFTDPRAEREMQVLPLKFAPYAHANGTPTVGVQVSLSGQDTLLSVESVLGMMIRHMGEIAAAKAQQADMSIPLDKLFPQDWVIGIPNYYTDSQRRAVLTACEIAGIGGVQRLMHESTATALAYGIFKDLRKEFTAENPSNVMFIDMGASSYTVSIATFEPGKLIVKSSFSDADLGGRDFDKAIAEYIASDFATKFKGKLSADPMSRPKTRLKILAAAEKAKKTLSPAGITEARISLEMLQDDLDYNGKLLASDYEAMCKPLLERLAAPLEAALAEAKLTSKDLTAVEIVGGSVRIGCVKRKLLEILGGIQLSTTMNADEAIARGCALQSAILSPRFKVLPYDIAEAQPYPIKVAWDDDKATGMEVDESGAEQPTDSVIMFDRGISFPVIRRVTLRRSGDFKVKAMYDDEAAKYGHPVGSGKEIAEFSIKMTTNEEHKIRVNVKADIHGILQLTSAQMIEEVEGAEEEKAEEGEEKKKKITKVMLDATTRRPIEWSSEEIKVANEMEVSMANNDRIVRETADMQNELESYIYDMRDKISSDSHLGPYGTEVEKSTFIAKNEEIQNWLYEDGFDATKSVFAEKLAELKKLGDPISARKTEAKGREAALKTLQGTLQLYQGWVNESQTNEAYAHITDEEREKVRAATETTSAWMYEMMDKQGGLSLSQDPVLKIAELEQKNKDLNTTCGPIMRKPKPAPKKEEPPKEESKPETKDEAKEEDVPMEDADKKEEEENGEAAPMEE